MLPSPLIGIRSIIFDMDGTLIRSSSIEIEALQNAFSRFFQRRNSSPPEIAPEQIIRGIGAPSDEFYRSLLPVEDQGNWKEFRDLVAEEEAKGLEKKRITFPGTIRVLKELKRRGYRLALVSNCNREYLDKVVETQHLERYFDLALCLTDGVGERKSDIFRHIIQQFGENSIVIGDRYYDVEAALENNLPCIGTLYGYGGRKELADTLTWVADIRDLLYYLNPLQEAVEFLAHTIIKCRDNNRPIVVGIDSPHPGISSPLINLLLDALIDLTVPVSYLSLEHHRQRDISLDCRDLPSWIKDSYPWQTLDEDVLEAAKSGVIDAAFTITSSKRYGQLHPCRGRPGSVVIVDSPFLFYKERSSLFDLCVYLKTTPGSIARHWNRISDSITDDFPPALPPAWFYYIKNEHPEKHADFILNHNQFEKGKLLAIL